MQVAELCVVVCIIRNNNKSDCVLNWGHGTGVDLFQVPPPELYEVKILDEPVPEVVQVISDVVAPPDLRKVKLVDEPVPEVVQVVPSI